MRSASCARRGARRSATAFSVAPWFSLGPLGRLRGFKTSHLLHELPPPPLLPPEGLRLRASRTRNLRSAPRPRSAPESPRSKYPLITVWHRHGRRARYGLCLTTNDDGGLFVPFLSLRLVVFNYVRVFFVFLKLGFAFVCFVLARRWIRPVTAEGCDGVGGHEKRRATGMEARWPSQSAWFLFLVGLA